MKSTLLWILGIALLASLLVNFDTCSRLRDSELTGQAIKSVWQADKAIADQEKASRDAWELAQDSVRKVDSARHAQRIGRLTGDLKASKRRERNSRPDTVIISLTDTIYLKYDTLVAELKNERDSLKISFEASIDTLKATVASQKGQIDLADSLIKEIKIPAEPSKLVFGLSAGYGLMNTSGEIRSGIFFGPSVTYKLVFKKRKKARKG